MVTPQQADYLKTLYYNVELVGALRGPQALYSLVKERNLHKISLVKIKNWLRAQDIYTPWKPAREPAFRNNIEAHFPGHILQFDLADFRNEKEIRIRGKKRNTVIYKYCLVAYDTFSKFGWVVPLREKKSKHVIAGLKHIFKTSNYLPKEALCDSAGEHISAQSKKFFKQKGINLYFANSKIHAPGAERLIKTLKIALRRYRASYNVNSWVKPLRYLVKAYNASISRVHKQTPKDVMSNPTLAWKAYEFMYLKKHRKDFKRRQTPRREFNPANTPKVGDHVRISRLRHVFEKEAGEIGLFSREIFIVDAVDRSQKIVMLKLRDLTGALVKGGFYIPEVQVVSYDPSELFEVEKIVARKMIGKTPMVRVKFKGYNLRRTQWMPESEIRGVAVNRLRSHIH